jgi:nucleotide-binding universal stress UspA family protein
MSTLRIRSILVATDLLESAAAVLESTVGLARRIGAEIHVLHALEGLATPYSAMGAAEDYQRRSQDARGALDDLARLAFPAGMRPASLEVRTAGAPAAILERAREIGADLIVIGPARPRPFRGPILGNTADRILRSARVPVLVLPGASSLLLRSVVVPLDLADPARGALDQGLLWADALRERGVDRGLAAAEVRVLYVIPGRYESRDFEFDRVVAGPQLHLEVEDARERVGPAPGVAVREELRWGDAPAEEIVRYVESEPTDLLVLGTHGYGALGRALVGSVTSRIVRAASCPMLLIPPVMWAVEPAPDRR